MVSRTRRRETQLAFDTLSIEGGLLSPEWLSRVAQLSAGQQSENDYRVPKGLNLRDEIGRYWRIAHAHWQEFASGLDQTKVGVGPGTGESLALAGRFVQALLRESFGFSSLLPTPPMAIDDRTYPIGLSALGSRVPVVVAPAGGGLDAASVAFGDGGRKRSPFGLAQEFLNAAEGSTWGIASDGLRLRILRDNASLTRPAWIEADLGRIFSEERYADFAALWLLAHESRFGRLLGGNEKTPSDCALDAWRAAGREEGTRAREDLREGFKEALLALGHGFLAHPENGALHAALRDGSLTKDAYFQQLLRLVYRFIFLVTAEERDLLHPPGTVDDARSLYAAGYGLKRLRDRSVKRSAHDRFSDLWDATKIVFRGLASAEPRLGLPALAGLFASAQCPSLDAARLENRALLLAVFRLSWLRQTSGLVRVNWRDMGPEELGSVYESLLELEPQITQEGRAFAFASGDETKGNARKKTGSYYTPDSLVQVLLESALEPVVQTAIARHPAKPVEALLRLSIVDPTCGSGHFLLAAARRLAGHVARLQSEGTPSAAEYRSAVRQVVAHCIYGVDLNPMAVELCKVSLWMEAVEPGLPLTFLDSHIQQGNALLGTTPELMEAGVPDAAWEPIEGDNRKVASALKKRNKDAASGQRGLSAMWAEPSETEAEQVSRAFANLEAATDADHDALARKESQWAGILDSDAYRHQRFVADAWCAAFVWPKQSGLLAEAAPTNELWRQVRDCVGQVPALAKDTIEILVAQYQFLHWHLAFPLVFARGGFDVVLGNPPWERVKLQEQEFFASRSKEIAEAPNAAARKKLIAKLPEDDPVMWGEWCNASREAEGQSHFVRQSGRYPLCGKGDVNTYALFAEHNRRTLGPQGRAGFIVPGGLVTDDSTKDYFETLVSTQSLVSVLHFENEAKIFPGVHHAQRFVLMTIAHTGGAQAADLVFYARRVEELAESDRHFTLTPAEFELLNPNTRTCPTFRSRRDAEINLTVYRQTGVLWRERPDINPWELRFLRMFDMATDSELFRSRVEMESLGQSLLRNQYDGPAGRHLPLLEAKMVHHFDHRFASYANQTEAQSNQGKLPEFSDDDHADPDRVPLPEYWVSSGSVDDRLRGRLDRDWFIGWRKITGTEKQRTVISAITPRMAAGDSYNILTSSSDPKQLLCLYANICSFCLDYAARQKVGGTNLVYHSFKQFPVLSPTTYTRNAPWLANTPLQSWVVERVLELAFTSWDLDGLARDVSHSGPPFRWDASRRFLLRAELDAAFFHLYGLSRDDAAYVLDTFPIVRKHDEKAHGEYRTKRVILEIYDAMAEATRTARPYETRLDPPPADPRVAHPDTRGDRR